MRRDLSERGVILAVCSKNDEANALEPFEKHPDMVLKRGGHRLLRRQLERQGRRICARSREQLNIGLDALVFVDDNPFERDLVRRELPMVAVPELPEDPALYARCLADAGYFEALHLTEEDLRAQRAISGQSASASSSRPRRPISRAICASLDMELRWGRFDRVGLQRIVQLINKTNQFNLTTRRYTEAEVAAVIADPAVLTLQMRLLDRFGDNGIIAHRDRPAAIATTSDARSIPG